MDYKSSGVNIDEGNRAVSLIKDRVAKTHTPFVMSQLGGFAAGVQIPKGYEEPVLVSCTDGVGTKLALAIELGIFDTVGIDLVAMCVNDLVCMGAKPLFFLDYIACHALDSNQVKDLVEGMVQGCLQSDCALVGGEMAEMNDLYRPGDFDLAGFCVGVVEKSKVIDGAGVKPGHFVYGFPSSGVHSNGFSLVRKVLTKEVCEKEGIGRQSLLEPTKIYVKQVLSLLDKGLPLTGIAHVTGGGLAENIERVLPKTVDIEIVKDKLPVKTVFSDIQRLGSVDEQEMFRVFNMGIGMVVVSAKKLEENTDCIYLGQVKDGSGDVRIV